MAALDAFDGGGGASDDAVANDVEADAGAADASSADTASSDAGAADASSADTASSDAATGDDIDASSPCGAPDGGPLCDDGNVCTADSCDSETGACVHTPTSDGEDCEDDDNACTLDVCQGGACTHPAVAAGAPCDADGSECTVGDACADGLCLPGATTDCDDGNVCTDDACAPALGCTHTTNTTACDDSIACTVDDTCSGGACAAGAPQDDLCDDGSFCDGAEICDPALGCVAGTPPLLDDGVACTADACDELLDVVVHLPQQASCSDGNVCTDDSCDLASGCTHTAAAAGSACGDDDSLWCQQGVCVFKQPPGAPEGMALIPAGDFWMGCNAALEGACSLTNKPQHQVTLSAYYMDLDEVTVDDYAACVSAGVCPTAGLSSAAQCSWGKDGFGNHPINCVDWGEASTYCAWANKRLPTEAEWEKAARGGCATVAGDCKTGMRTHPWGEAAASCSYAVMNDGGWGCGTLDTLAVGSKSPAGDSPYGARDMAGNVHEWVADWFSGSFYKNTPAENPTGPSGGDKRVFRGGSWAVTGNSLRSSARFSGAPDYRSHALGFRCAADAPVVCGDGVLGGDEECDDGNLSGGDGCSASCALEPGYEAMVHVPKGTFWMGCNAANNAQCKDNELPPHEVMLSAFYIDSHEVTAGEYAACVGAGACTSTGLNYASSCTYGHPAKAAHPVNCVDHDQSVAYCAWAGKRLPTEAEWEKAARGGCETVDGVCKDAMRTFPWGEEGPSCDRAVMISTLWGCGTNSTWPVGSKSPAGDSPYGVKDAAGSVWEWVADWVAPYQAGPQTNPTGPTVGSKRGARGGSWGNSGGGLTTTYREYFPPTSRLKTLGFRCARDP